MGTGRYLDQLCEAVPDLCCSKSTEECEVEESVDWSMVCTESVLVVPIVDCYFDRDRSINETDNGSGNSNEVGVTSVCSARKTN